ncbi:MAG: hypothetical protein FK734_07970 [Asgard group archaeon]|nr:hypothetical protein [Asgard group archaeon]
MNPQELDELTIIVSNIWRKECLQEESNISKKSGEIFINKKRISVAVRTFKNNIKIEPGVKQNWLNLTIACRGVVRSIELYKQK